MGTEENTNPDKLADQVERTAEEMSRRSERLEDEIDDARGDWERKRADASVPGAVPAPEPDTPEQTSDDQQPPAKRDPDE
jgi:hypothetical protein